MTRLHPHAGYASGPFIIVPFGASLPSKPETRRKARVDEAVSLDAIVSTARPSRLPNHYCVFSVFFLQSSVLSRERHSSLVRARYFRAVKRPAVITYHDFCLYL